MRASLLCFCAIVLLAGVGTAQADEWIPGYVAANGAYVPGHWESDDGNSANNYSNLQNVNPYTARPRPKPENHGAYVDPNDDRGRRLPKAGLKAFGRSLARSSSPLKRRVWRWCSRMRRRLAVRSFLPMTRFFP